MPRIPIYREDTTALPTNPQGVDIASGGRTGAALSGLGSELTSFGNQLLAERKKAQDSDYAFQTSLKEKMDAELFELELQQRVPKDGAGYFEAVNQYVGEKFEQSQLQAPSNTAKRLYQQSIGGFYESMLVKARGFENKKRIDSYVTGITDNIDEISKHQLEIPNDISALDSLNEIENHINGANFLSEEAKTELLKLANNRIGKGVIEGLLISAESGNKQMGYLALHLLKGKSLSSHEIEYTPEEAVNAGFITSQEYKTLSESGKNFKRKDSPVVSFPNLPERSKVIRGLTPEKKAEYLKRALRVIKTKDRLDLSSFNNRVRDFIALSSDGVPSLQEYESLVAENRRLFSDDKQKQANNFATLTSYFSLAENMGQIKDYSYEELSEDNAKTLLKDIEEEIKSEFKGRPGFEFTTKPEFAARIRIAARNTLRSMQEASKRSIESDAAGFYYKTNPAIKNQIDIGVGNNNSDMASSGYELLFQTQRQNKVPYRALRVLPKDKSKYYGDLYNSQTSARSKVVALDKLKKDTGRMFEFAVNDFVKDNKIDSRVKFVSFIESPAAKEAIINSILIKGSDLRTKYAQVEKVTKDDIFEKVDKETKKKLDALSIVGDGFSVMGEAATIRSIVHDYAKVLYLNGTSKEDAAKSAADVVLGEFDSISVNHRGIGFGLGANESNIFFKKKHSAENIEAYIRKTMTKEELLKYDFVLPESVYEKITAIKNPSRDAEYILKNGFFKTSQDLKSISLYIMTESGVPLEIKINEGGQAVKFRKSLESIDRGEF